MNNSNNSFITYQWNCLYFEFYHCGSTLRTEIKWNLSRLLQSLEWKFVTIEILSK